jgi:hypothetical protein
MNIHEKKIGLISPYETEIKNLSNYKPYIMVSNDLISLLCFHLTPIAGVEIPHNIYRHQTYIVGVCDRNCIYNQDLRWEIEITSKMTDSNKSSWRRTHRN